jgi:PAS domain S-box-containing protein
MTDEYEPNHLRHGKSEERFKLLVESVKDYGIFTLDCQGYITSWNEGARRIKGYEAHEIIGSHFSRFYTPEDLAADKPQWELERAVADGRVEDEGWRLRKDGTRFWADVVITALFDPATGEHRGFGKVTRDLTERKHHEERLRQSEEQFRLLVERVDEYAIFMLDATGHVATWNSGAQKIKQYTVEEIVGEHFERFYLPEDRAAGKPQRLLKIAEEKGHVHDQGLRMRKDGTIFHADVLITSVRDRTGTLRGFSKVTRDITDQIRNREAEAARLVAEKANKAKDEFLAVLSHELRTPLTPVLANAEYLIANLDEISREEEIEMLTAIQRNARLEAQLIDDLLDLTRISRGKIELKFEAVDVHGAIADAISILTPQFGEKGLSLRNELTARDHWMWADPTRLRQVFWNLLTNAVKFTPAGGHIVVRSFSDSSDRLVVEVRDSGIGIEPEQLARIFNAFEQGERKVTRQFGGLGLGLAITRSIVQMHHGVIAASSDGKGKGAVFQLQFAGFAPGRLEQAVPPPIVFGPRYLRILLVDDHEDTRRILANLLRKLGHTVEVAESVSTATVALETLRFDVLVSDIGLPDATGHDLMVSARTIQPEIKGIALSGFGMDDDLQRSAQAGFAFHLTKPVDITVLQQRLLALGVAKT